MAIIQKLFTAMEQEEPETRMAVQEVTWFFSSRTRRFSRHFCSTVDQPRPFTKKRKGDF